MSGTIVVDRIESDASYASSINIASPLVISNTVNMNLDGAAQVFNRTTSDGTVVEIRKDGTTVGHIGTVDGDIFISGTGHGIKFDEIDATAMYLRPCNESGTNENGQIDLGQSGNAFRDAYLSGGLYFSPHSYPANYLDDYEEGTFTPTLAASGYTFAYASQSASYTKIGNLVTVKIYIQKTTTTGSGTTALYIGGLPFTSANQNYNFSGSSMSPDGGSSWFTNVPNFRTEPNSTSLRLLTGFNGASLTANFNVSTMPNPTEFEISAFYYAA